MSQFGDVLQQGLTSVGNFGGDALKAVGDVGGAIGKEAMALPGQVEGLFGMGGKDPTGVAASGNPVTNAAAGGLNGTTGAVGPAAASAGTGGASAASFDPSSLNYGSSPISAPQLPAGIGSVPTTPGLSGAADVQGLQLGPGGAPVGNTPSLTGASGMPDASGYMREAAAGAANPVVATPQLGVHTDGLTQYMAKATAPVAGAGPAAGAAHPNAIQSLIKTLTTPEALKMELPGALFGLNAINAMQPTSQEKAMKAQLANAQRQQAGEQNILNSEQAGFVPASLQQGIDLREKQAEAAVRARYAQAGMSGSSAEAADITAAKTDAALQTFQEAQSMISQTSQLLGGYDTEVSQYLTGLFNAEAARDAALRNSIVGFLSAAGYAAPGAAAAGK